MPRASTVAFAARPIRPTSKGALYRLELKRDKLDLVVRKVADGFFAAGQHIVERASAIAPDSPYDPYPTGEGLPKQGGVLVFVEDEKVNGWSIRGDQPKKPRAVRGSTKEHSIVCVIGFGFPARFNELGTLKMPANPFLAPVRDNVGPTGVVVIVGDVARPEIARIP